MQVKEITLRMEEPGAYEVIVDDATTGTLSWGELVDQVASLTHPDIRRPRFDMLTRAEWNARAWRHHCPKDPCDDWSDHLILDLPF